MENKPMNTKGGAYIFVLIISLGIFLLLAVALNITVYQARASAATANYANLSLLARAGVERAVLALNSQMAAERASVAGLALARFEEGGDYPDAFIEETAELGRRFEGTELVYSLTLPHSGDDGIFTVTVRITPANPPRAGRLLMTSVAVKHGLPAGETVRADIVLSGDVNLRYAGEAIIADSDLEWRIERLRQLRD
jgi:hypothetical protein